MSKRMSRLNRARLIAAGIDPLSKKAALVLKVTTALRKALQSKVADLLISVIPGEVDAIVRAGLIAALDKAIEALTLKKKPKSKRRPVADFIDQLRAMPIAVQDALIVKAGAEMLKEIDGAELPGNQYDLIIQSAYSANK